MPSRAELVMRIERVADELGVWCTTCALPSGIRRTYVATVGERVTIGNAALCLDCGTVLR